MSFIVSSRSYHSAHPLTLRAENENARIISAFDNSNTAFVSNIPPFPRKHGIPAATEIPAPR